MVISADCDCAGDQSGRACFNSAPAPATCGLDIDVPEMNPWTSASYEPDPSAARTSTPGAVIDGTITSIARLGPRDEKLAMMSPRASSMVNVVPAIAA